MVVALLTAALVAPYFIDWTGYRSDFEREAGRILGREVTVEGTARARLLPFPSVTFTDVKVAGRESGEPAMTVDEFSMDAELAPFLSGEVLIFDMRLVHPRARIVIDESGGIDWAVRSSGAFNPGQVTLEKVTISDGSIELVHEAGGRAHHLTGINADLSARSLAGPWRVDGSLAIDGMETAMSIATGKADADGMRVHMQVRPADYPLEIETDGRAGFDDKGAATYAGTFRLLADTAAVPVSGDVAAKADKTDAPNRVTGKFNLSNEKLAIEEFRLETGSQDDPYTADGEAFIDIGQNPRFSVKADGAQINFDAEPATEQAGGAGAMSLEERLASFRGFLLEIPRPSIPGTVEVNLPAIVAGDTTIRSISLTAEPTQGGWLIGSVAATLPGRTRFEGHGLLTTQDQLGFTGSIVLAVRQPSGFAAWLARDVDDAIRRLPAAGFSADVELGPERQTFSNLELILGDARFRGQMIRHQPPDARPSMSVKLTGDKLDVEGMAAFASLFVSDQGAMRLAGHDIDFDIEAGPVSAGGLTADSIDTVLRLQQGTLEIDRLKIDGLAGASVSATGTVKDLATSPTGKLDASVVSVDLAPLVEALARRFPDNRLVAFLRERSHFYPGLLEDAEIDFVASAAADKDDTTGLALSAEGTAGATRFSLSVSGSGKRSQLADASFSAGFTAHNDEAAVLYALYGLPAIPLGFAGGADTELSLQGTLAGGMKTHFLFTGQGLKANADGTAVLGDNGLAFTGEGALSADDLEPWLAVGGIVLPGFGYGLPTTLSSQLELRDGRLSLPGLDGSVAATTVSGNLIAQMKEAKPHITGSLALKTLDLALPAAMALGDSALSMGFGLPWPDEPFRQGMRAPFTADVALKVGRLYFGRVAAGSDAAMEFTLDTEGVRLAGFSAGFDGGTLTGLAGIRNNAGSALFSAQYQLEGADLAELLPGGALSGSADLGGSLTASGKSVAGLVAGLSGSGSIAFQDLSIADFDPDAFAPILATADEIGHDIKAADTARFAPDMVRRGNFEAGSVKTAFTVAGGVLRTPPVQLDDGSTVLTADMRVDLAERRAEIKGGIAYDPGLEAVTGSDPMVRFTAAGPIGGLETRLDTQPLAQYLTQRTLEREEARVEHMQAVLLEKQRLRREAQYYAALDARRRRADEERHHFEIESERIRKEQARKAREEAERARVEERRRRAEEAARGADESSGSEPAPDEGAAGEIERAPLPPPDTASGDSGGGATPDEDISKYFDAEDLTIDGLMKLLGPRK